MTFDRSAGLCAQTDPDEWFPDTGVNPRTAVRMCWLCDQRIDCLREALDTGERWGVWGGMSAKHLNQLRRQPVQGCALPPAIAAVPDLPRKPSRARRHHSSQPNRANTGTRVA